MSDEFQMSDNDKRLLVASIALGGLLANGYSKTQNLNNPAEVASLVVKHTDALIKELHKTEPCSLCGGNWKDCSKCGGTGLENDRKIQGLDTTKNHTDRTGLSCNCGSQIDPATRICRHCGGYQ